METKKVAKLTVKRKNISGKHASSVTVGPIVVNRCNRVVSAPSSKKFKITFEVVSEEVGEALIALGAVNATITGIEEKGKESHEA